MKMTKKVLSVLLALVLAFSVLAIMPSALAPDSAVDIYIRTDKTNYKPGEVIHFTISQQVDPVVGMMQNAGVYPVAYNNVAIEPISDITDDLEPHNFKYLQPGSDDTIDDLMPFDGSIPMEEEGAAKYGWNDSFIINSANDGVTEIDNTKLLDFYTFDLKVKADAPAGDYVIGFNQNSYVNYQGIAYDAINGGIAGWDDDNGYGTKTNYSLGTCTIHVGNDAPATSPLNRVNTQYKLGADGNSFDLRTISSISVADMEALVGASDAATIKANVKALGFVATDDAKVQLDGVKAALAAGGKAEFGGKTYVVGTTNTLVATGTDFQFRAMLSSAKDRIPADGLKLQAFIQKNDDTFTFYAADLNLTADMIK